MLRLPEFVLERPETLEEACALLREHGSGARIIAGGTDLVVNMKQGFEGADVLVSLSKIPGLTGIEDQGGGLVIGAMTTLEQLAEDAQVAARFPGLSQAAGLVAGPHQRRMGTIGGNVCLNTRCVYINQTQEWREALGHCLKGGGDVCHVVPGGKNCVAAASNDTATALISLGATLEIAGADGMRQIHVADFFNSDGISNKMLEQDEILTGVLLPAPPDGAFSGYEKLRPRGSIDYPRLSVAVAGAAEEGRITDLVIVISALAAKPLVLRQAQEMAAGRMVDDALLDELAVLATTKAKPLSSIDGDQGWRREMAGVLVTRALVGALGL